MKRTAIVLAGLLVLLSGAVALAAIPSADGTIHGCRETKTGALRVIDAEAGQTCTTKETALVWNQRGPQGLAGPAGPQGEQGPPGPAGSGLSGYEVVRNTQNVTVPPDEPAGITVSCPSGKVAFGGGGHAEAPGQLIVVFNHTPLVGGPGGGPLVAQGWGISFRDVNPDVGPYTAELTVWAICANVT